MQTLYNRLHTMLAIFKNTLVGTVAFSAISKLVFLHSNDHFRALGNNFLFHI